MHTATRGPGRRKQHYSQATFNMHLEAVTTDRNIAMAHSAAHRSSLKQDRSVTLQGEYQHLNCNHSFTAILDVKLILPTLLILLFTVFIMVTVIPYAFSSVIKQLRAVQALEAAGRDIPAPTSSTSEENKSFLSETAQEKMINVTEREEISNDFQ